MAGGHRPKGASERLGVHRFVGADSSVRADVVVVEEPMEIRVGPVGAPDDGLVPLAVTMRTPGHDFELAAGFVLTEGIAPSQASIRGVAYCGLPRDEQEYNVVTVRLDVPADLDRHRRNVYTTSSCGLCGKASIDAIEVVCRHRPVSGPIAGDVVVSLPDQLRAEQRVFDATGGLHAAGLFELDGAGVVVREDVGRHNAVDKVVGWAAQRRAVPLSDRVLAVSGRASFEIVQKAAVVGIGIVVAVSAPSSLAVRAAERFGMTLVGFTRDDRFSVYSGVERVRAAGATVFGS